MKGKEKIKSRKMISTNDLENGTMGLSDSLIEAFFAVRLGNTPKYRQTHQYYELHYQVIDNFARSQLLSLLPPRESTVIRDSTSVLPIKEYQLQSLPPRSRPDALRIVVISDTHDRHYALETLPECDFLIHSGDILMTSRKLTYQYAYLKFQQFAQWFNNQPAKHKIVIGGNHDKLLERLSKEDLGLLFGSDIHYLCNDVITLDGITIYGTPISEGDSKNQAFQSEQFDEETQISLCQYLEAQETGQVPPIDLLITHGPNRGLRNLVKPQLFHISGHSHHYHGVYVYESRKRDERLVNVCAPIMDSRYKPVNLPVVIDCLIDK